MCPNGNASKGVHYVCKDNPPTPRTLFTNRGHATTARFGVRKLTQSWSERDHRNTAQLDAAEAGKVGKCAQSGRFEDLHRKQT
jgi:hypothetical protein